jgi:hypothetical protein
MEKNNNQKKMTKKRYLKLSLLIIIGVTNKGENIDAN